MKKVIALLIMSGMTMIAHANTATITVYKDANCGCCEAWVTYMKDAGYNIKAVDSVDMQSIKAQYKVPENLQSCHTSILSSTGQVIEGHVPVAAVEKLAKISPLKVRGITVPGMKSNSPGMGTMNGQLVTLDFKNQEFSKD